MIFGIGIDIVAIERIGTLLEHYPERLPKRLLTEGEMQAFQALSTEIQKITFLAKRFAAKEAAVKALGLGFSENLTLKHIEVTTASPHSKQPALILHGDAHTYLVNHPSAQGRIPYYHLSIADDAPMATAMVCIELR